MKSNRLLGIRWSTLGRFHAIKAVRTMYFWVLVVPIAAKLLEHTGGQATICAFSSCVRLQLALPFSWIAFYFSAVCFALAEVVYLARCPYNRQRAVDIRAISKCRQRC